MDFPTVEGGKELSLQGVSGTGGDEEDDEGTHPKPACQGHCNHTGGGQPPLPTVPPLQFDGDLEGSEREARHHRSLCQGGGMGETTAGRRRDAGKCEEGLSGLRQKSRDVHIVQITGASLDGGG